MSLSEIIFLFLVAMIAGGMNAVAGGGTILTFPALIAFGMPAIQANATSTLALLVGMVGSFYGYRAHLPAVKPWLTRFAPVSILGGLIGAWLLTVTSENTFSMLVPFLILFATILFFANNAFSGLTRGKSFATTKKPALIAAAIVLQFLVAIYGGYFGAGIGILMLGALGIMGMQHIHEMNAIKTILAALINIVATIYFIFAGFIIWPQALIMIVGATGGYFLGSHGSQRISQIQVRRIIIAIGLGISALMFWRQFFSAH